MSTRRDFRENKRDIDSFSEELLESENDRRLQNVAGKVSTLKHIVLDLRTEVKDQVKLINDSGGMFETASSLLGGTLNRIKGLRIARLQNCKYMWYFSLVAIVFLFLVYLLMGHVMSS